MTNKSDLVNNWADAPKIMSESVDKKQKIILDKWTLIVFIATIIIVLLKVFG